MDSDWASLPVNLLDSISEEIISTRDCLNFGAVCTSWQSVANCNTNKRINSPRHEVPLLMIQSEHGYSHDVYDVTNDKFLKSKLVARFNQRFCGSSLGWLVSANSDLSVTLHKPSFTNSAVRTIQLPYIDQLGDVVDFVEDNKRLEYAVSKAVISADPIKNPDQCMVMAVCDYCMRLSYIRPSKDTAWSYIALKDLIKAHCDDIIFYNDHFYAVTSPGDLICFEVTQEPFKLNPKFIIKVETRFVQGEDFFFGSRYLVESNGKLLHVERHLDFEYGELISRATERFGVLEFDSDGKSWKEIEQDIGDHALFLGDNASISISASKFSGCKSNSIYFTHDQDCHFSSRYAVSDFGVYDIGTGTIDLNFNVGAECLRKIGKRVPIWIEPYN